MNWGVICVCVCLLIMLRLERFFCEDNFIHQFDISLKDYSDSFSTLHLKCIKLPIKCFSKLLSEVT